ncbi:hypothetical protein L1987_22182 [Smallanthus sonchifolius]|uniref:Uncharacterized protein n=1 Tax=Smallanthus sonchifolius TaxID=185202 RepID=A0ACB9IFH9_9ASTR|nr:hypothetical protein L1987_22182 [Smallanthus sonchifolius]
MWRSRRESSREIDSINGSMRRSCSNLNFVRSSLKDVENLLADDDTNCFNKTLDQLSPCSATATTTTTAAAARRLSIFHRVHLANKFARAFSTKESPNSENSPPDSKNAAAAAKLGKSDGLISIPDSNNAAAAEKMEKSDRVISISDSNNAAAAEKLGKPDRVFSIPDSNNDSAAEKLKKSERVISIPGAEKRVVLYMTSLRVVRPTFEACRTVQSILRGFRVSIDERDLSMDSKLATGMVESVFSPLEVASTMNNGFGGGSDCGSGGGGSDGDLELICKEDMIRFLAE